MVKSGLTGAILGGLLSTLPLTSHGQQRVAPDLEAAPFAPRRYVPTAPRPSRPSTASSTSPRGQRPPGPTRSWTSKATAVRGRAFATRAKMLWDDEHFYVAAEMEEPDLWGTLTERDSVIFHDNDFEIFIDPDGDTHAYYELEVNALGTAWDLMLMKPYRDGGRAIDAWDIAGLQVGVDLRGTINRPGDRDDGWTVEIAMPWRILREAAPDRKAPQPGDRWRVNFSRVQWQVDTADGRYAKRLKPGTKDPLPEDNWVWSPQGAINMHMPERWGYVQFSGVPAGSRYGAIRRGSERARQVGAAPAVLSSAGVAREAGAYASTLKRSRRPIFASTASSSARR